MTAIAKNNCPRLKTTVYLLCEYLIRTVPLVHYNNHFFTLTSIDQEHVYACLKLIPTISQWAIFGIDRSFSQCI